jgi:hypothetical protein
VGNIEQSVCDVFNYLFLPSDDEQADLYQRFQGQWTQISNRVPFGYVGIINTAFTDFQDQQLFHEPDFYQITCG